MQCGHILVPDLVHVRESVGMKESTLVINVNRPFMLRGSSGSCLPAYILQTNMYPQLLKTLAEEENISCSPCLVIILSGIILSVIILSGHYLGILDLYPPCWQGPGMQGKHISD